MNFIKVLSPKEGYLDVVFLGRQMSPLLLRFGEKSLGAGERIKIFKRFAWGTMCCVRVCSDSIAAPWAYLTRQLDLV